MNEAPARTFTSRLLELVRNAGWALRQMWRTGPGLTAAWLGANLLRAGVPLGVALFARGLVDTFVDVSDEAVFAPLIPWLLFGLAVMLAEAICPLLSELCQARLQTDVQLEITAELLEQASRLDLAFFEDTRRQDLIERAREAGAQQLTAFAIQCMATLRVGLQGLSLAGILLVIEPLAVLVVGPFALPYLFFQWRLARGRFRHDNLRAPGRRWSNYFSSLLLTPRTVPEIKLLGLGPLLVQQFRKIMGDLRDGERRLQWRGFLAGLLYVSLTTAAFFAIYYRVVHRAFVGELTIGEVAIFGASSARLRNSLERCLAMLGRSLQAAMGVSHLRGFLAAQSGQMQSSATLPEAEAGGRIELEQVEFCYPGRDAPVLQGVSFAVEPGEVVGLVGENGAGKTTLAKLICRLYDPTAGTIRLDGQDLHSLDPEWLRHQIGFVFQDFCRFEATAADSIAYGDWHKLAGNREALTETAERTGADSLIARLPDGLDTRLGRQFGQVELSGGEWQALAVARAFARSPRIVLLDEPTSGLDARAEYQFFARFRELARGCTTLLISHRFSTLSLADRIVVLRDGKVVETGSHDALVAQAGYYAQLYRLHRLQMDGETDAGD